MAMRGLFLASGFSPMDERRMSGMKRIGGNGFHELVMILKLLEIKGIILDGIGNETQKGWGEGSIWKSGVKGRGYPQQGREENSNFRHRIVLMNCKDV